MADKPQFSLAEFSQEEGKQVTKELEELLNKFSGAIVCIPFINQNGTIAGRAELFKKIPVVDDSIPSPFIVDGETPKTS